jgi:hypothetical protein
MATSGGVNNLTGCKTGRFNVIAASIDADRFDVYAFHRRTWYHGHCG